MINLNHMTVLEGFVLSLFIILIVFLILWLLSLILSLLKYLPSAAGTETAEKAKKGGATLQAAAAGDMDREEYMVAVLTAACVAKRTLQKDVRIISCKRIK